MTQNYRDSEITHLISYGREWMLLVERWAVIPTIGIVIGALSHVTCNTPNRTPVIERKMSVACS